MAIDMNPARGEVYSVAVVIAEASDFPEMRRGLLPAFRAILADNERAIKDAVEDSSLQSMLFDLDSVGEGARDGVDVLQEIRAIRDDLVLVAMTRSRDHNLPLRASQAGADEFVLGPVNYQELQSVLARAIEKRAHEMEGRRVVQQLESKSAFLFTDRRKRRDAKALSNDSGGCGQQYHGSAAWRKWNRQGADRQRDRAVQRPSRAALHLPELFRLAGVADRIGNCSATRRGRSPGRIRRERG